MVIRPISTLAIHPPAVELTKYKAALLLKMYRGRKFGSSHLLEDNLLKGFPSDEIGALGAALDKLIKEGTLTRKKTAHGDAISIPHPLHREIYEALKKYYPWLPKPPWY